LREQTEDDIFESEDAQGALLVIEGYLGCLKSYLPKRLQVLFRISEFLGNESFFLAEDRAVGVWDIRGLGNSEERFRSYLVSDIW
jgi:hypothetical protein